jgi:DNA primase
MITSKSKEEILAAARLEEVISDFITLKKRGSNYLAHCPFHTEKTPSFTVSPAKGYYKCYGCGKWGDVVTFLMEHEKFTYPDALRWLARRYNIELEETGNTRDEQDSKLKKESLYIITQFAADYFHHNLLETEEGKTSGLTYFRERGVSDEMIRRFQLGYALQISNSFTRQALKSGYQLSLLQEAGLTTHKSQSENDFLHHRVIFPIHTLSGKVAAFAGRSLITEAKIPKYINSPETEIYKKSMILYGLFQSRNAIRKEDECYLTEGYLDVITLHQAGIENAVASSGTSLTEEQIKLIKRFTGNITLLYDGDEAGIEAALRGIELMAAHDVNLRVVLIPDGEDPDSFIRKNGTLPFRELLQQSKKHFLRFKAERLLSQAGDDPLKKASAIREVIKTLALITDTVKLSLFIGECSNLLNVSQAILLAEVNKLKQQQFRKKEFDVPLPVEDDQPAPSQKAPSSSREYIELNLVRILLESGNKPLTETETVARFILNAISDIPLLHADCRLFFREWKTMENNNLIPDLSYFQNHEDEALRAFVANVLTSPYQLSDNWKIKHEIYVSSPEMNYKKDVLNTLDHFQHHYFKAEKAENLAELKAATNEEAARELQQVQIQLNTLSLELSRKLGIVV